MRQIILYLISSHLASEKDLSGLEVVVAWLGAVAHLTTWSLLMFFEVRIYNDNFDESPGTHLLSRVVLASLVLSSVSAGVLGLLAIVQGLSACICSDAVDLNRGIPPVLTSVVMGSMRASLTSTLLILVGAMASESVSKAQLFDGATNDIIIGLFVLKTCVLAFLMTNAKHKSSSWDYTSTKPGAIL